MGIEAWSTGKLRPFSPNSVCPVLKGHHFGHFFEYVNCPALVVAIIKQSQVQPCKDDFDAVND